MAEYLNKGSLMQEWKPIRYGITINKKQISEVIGPGKAKKFVSPVTAKGPKLYVVLHNSEPVYVGATTISAGTCIRSGFRDKYRYEWRKYLNYVDVDIWRLWDQIPNAPGVEETVEAEVVFLFRKTRKQWPRYQTEIHFHQSNSGHRELARRIVNYYEDDSCPTG